jgi:hypothetical protein
MPGGADQAKRAIGNQGLPIWQLSFIVLTMPLSRREILEQVANGELSPEEADELLREAAGDAAAPSAAAVPSRVTRLKIRSGFGAIVVVGDETVAEAEVDGMHQASHEDDTLVIHSDLDPDIPGAFEIDLGRHRRRRGRLGIAVGPMVFGASGKGRPLHKSSLRVRMNPSLELDVRLDAGSLSLSHLRAPVRARMSAGPITIEDFTAPLDVSVNAGAIRALGELTYGESRIKSDAGAVRVSLSPSSNVRIVADTALGRIVLPDHDPETGKRFSSRREATIGAGEATLRVETAMGSINVTTSDMDDDRA